MKQDQSGEGLWWAWFVAVSIIVVFGTVILPHLSSEAHPIAVYTFSHLNLAAEMNFAAWWIGVLLFIVGLICYELYSTENNETKWSWLFISIVFIGFSFDEMASIHERVLGKNWLVIGLLLSVGGVLTIYMFWRLLRTSETRKTAILLLTGLAFMVSAAPQEFLEHSMEWPSYLQGIRTGMEEGAEILGVLICLYAVVRQRTKTHWPTSFSRAIPDPSQMHGLMLVMGAGFIMHVALSVATGMHLDLTQILAGRRGNPGVYFPSIMFLVMAGICYWKSFEEEKRLHRRIVLSSAAVATVASIVTFYVLTPGSVPLNYFWVPFLIVFVLFLVVFGGNMWRTVGLIVALVALVVVELANGGAVTYIIAGFLVVMAEEALRRGYKESSVGIALV